VEFYFHSVKKSFSAFFYSSNGLLAEIAIKGSDVDDLCLFVDMVAHNRGKQSETLTVLFKLKKIIPRLWNFDWFEFIKNSLK